MIADSNWIFVCEHFESSDPDPDPTLTQYHEKISVVDPE